jgi:predicted  nucleic acid-binding Zn-ribbon protein
MVIADVQVETEEARTDAALAHDAAKKAATEIRAAAAQSAANAFRVEALERQLRESERAAESLAAQLAAAQSAVAAAHDSRDDAAQSLGAEIAELKASLTGKRLATRRTLRHYTACVISSDFASFCSSDRGCRQAQCNY